MKKLLFIAMLFHLFGAQAQYVTLSGYVRDADNGEDLIGVSVYTTEPRYGTVTNSYGFYSMTLPAGSYKLNVSYLGYSTINQSIKLSENKTLNFSLKTETQELQEVVVTENRIEEQLTKPQMSVAKLSAKEIKKIPQFLGEVDVVRTLTLLPGVSTVGEGANGFNVRGGNVDQNLILIDDAPVFNSSHLFGFFSIFNGDAVKDVQLYKGGMPAQYGGRLSSVLDVRQKDGNNQRFSGTGGLGLLSSRLMLEGPIVKDKVSFMVAGRRSYQDIFFGLSNDPEISNTKLYFYDLNGKVSWEINSRNKVYLSAYYGRDLFGANDLFDFGWGNGTVTLRWNYLITPKLFMNVTGVYSDYTYNLGTPDTDVTPFKWDSRIKNYMGKSAFTWYASTQHKVDFGAEATYYQFDPGVISGVFNASLQKEYALEPALYVNDEWKINNRLTIAAGLRYAWFYNLGSRSIRYYADGAPIIEDNVIDEQSFNNGEVIAQYGGLDGFEPRLGINYRLTEVASLKFSYNRNRQFIHLISNGTTPTPIDIWRPAGTYIKPAVVNQVAVGWFQGIKDNQFSLSVESYYKTFQNLVDYKNGANLIFTDHIETELLSGRGRAYGLELMFEKKAGSLTGWISYTLSRTERQVDKGPDPTEWINDGEWYLSNYDKTHDVSLVLSYEINKKWDISMNFAYQTGRPMTPPESRSSFETIAYPVTINRNSQRIPDYHRLDVAANYYFKQKPGRRWNHSLNIGVYNVYARKNAYSVFFRQNNDTGQTEAVRLSIFATAIPSITYNFTF